MYHSVNTALMDEVLLILFRYYFLGRCQCHNAAFRSSCTCFPLLYCCIGIMLTRVMMMMTMTMMMKMMMTCTRNVVNWLLTENNLQMKVYAVSCTLWLEAHIDAVVTWRSVSNSQHALSGR